MVECSSPPIAMCFTVSPPHVISIHTIMLVCAQPCSLCICVYETEIYIYIRLSDGFFSVQFENPVSFTRGSLIVHSIHFVHTHLFVRCVVSFLLLTCVLFILFALFSIHILYSSPTKIKKLPNFFSKTNRLQRNKKIITKRIFSLLFKLHTS